MDDQPPEALFADSFISVLPRPTIRPIGLDDDDGAPEYLVFFIPGNPGMIGFYRPFLSFLSAALARQLGTGPGSGRVVVMSRCHFGFETKPSHYASAAAAGSCDGSWLNRTGVHVACGVGVDEQVARYGAEIRQMAAAWARHRRPDGDRRRRRQVRIVLVGHSVGAFIVMRLAESFAVPAPAAPCERPGGCVLRLGENDGNQAGDGDVDVSNDDDGVELGIAGQALLFPTLTDLAKSPNGRIFWVLAGLKVVYVPLTVVSVFLWLLPRLVMMVVGTVLAVLIRWKTAAHPVIWQFLKLPAGKGIVRAVALGRDEMKKITDDRFIDWTWGIGPEQRRRTEPTDEGEDDEFDNDGSLSPPLSSQTCVAGSGSASVASEAHEQPDHHRRSIPAVPAVYVLFAETDRWVSNSSRDQLIERKAARVAELTRQADTRQRAAIDWLQPGRYGGHVNDGEDDEGRPRHRLGPGMADGPQDRAERARSMQAGLSTGRSRTIDSVGSGRSSGSVSNSSVEARLRLRRRPRPGTASSAPPSAPPSPPVILGPVFEIDRTGIRHSFCLDDPASLVVAEKTAEFVYRVIQEDEQRSGRV